MRHLLFAALVLFVLVSVAPDAAASAMGVDRRVVIVDSDGNERHAYMRWKVVVHERGDVVTGANGTLKITFLDSDENLVWRVTSADGRMTGSTRSDRRAFLRLLLTPVGPASSAGDTVAVVSFDQPPSIDQTGRVKVQFAWDIEGVGSINATGDMTIKGKKILQN